MKSEGGYFTNLNSAKLVATFFALWFAVYFEHSVEDSLAYVLILSFGILHGANDIKLLQVAGNQEVKKKSLLRILMYYVVFVLVVAGLFYLIPGIALALFVLFSAYHFGEQHWVNRIQGSSWEENIFYTAYGLTVLSILFLAHAGEVASIVNNITGMTVGTDILNFILVLSVLSLIVLYLKTSRKFTSETVVELFYLVVFFVVFNTASLLWSFAIYFIVWHSIPSLSDQIAYLYGDLNKDNFLKYLKTSWLYWGISVLALIGLFILMDDKAGSFLPFLFSFLAAITFPHVFVIRNLNKG